MIEKYHLKYIFMKVLYMRIFCYRLMLPGNCIMIMQKKQPIIDYHCHLNPEYIAKDHVSTIWADMA